MMMNFKLWFENQINNKPSPFIEGRNFMLIGVAHAEGERGTYPPIILKPSTIKKAKKFANYGVYFDGPHMESPIKHFLEDNQINIKSAQSWEPTVAETPHIETPALLTCLFGGHAPTWIKDLVLSHKNYDPKKTVVENLANTSSNWADKAWFPNGVSAVQIRNLVKQIANHEHAKETLQLVSRHKNRTHEDPQVMVGLLNTVGTEQNIHHMYEIGHSLTMEAEYDGIRGLENHQGRTFGQQNARAITDLRDRHLVESFLRKPGLYFAGYSHIQPVKEILQKNQIQYNWG